MIRFQPNAQSEILRAARILQVRIDSFQAGGFRPDPPFMNRNVALILTLTAVSKGEVREAPGDRLQIEVIQTVNAGSRFTAVPGVWSRVELAADLELIAFTGPEGTTAVEALVDPACFLVTPADPAASDVAKADQAEDLAVRVADLIARLHSRTASFGILFVRYLLDRLPEVFPDHVEDFDALLRLLEAPELDASARFALCQGMVGAFILAGSVRIEMMRRLLQSLFQLLTMPEAEGLRQNLAVTWIPNLVGIEGGMDRLAAADVLDGPLRAAAVVAVEPITAAAPLLAWLRS